MHEVKEGSIVKLLYCGHCHDIVRLFPERRACRCGRSWGQYLPDNSTTVQTPYSLSVGLANPDFQEAVAVLMQNRDVFSPALSIRAWLNPDSEADVKYVADEDGGEETEPASEQTARPETAPS